MYSDIVPLHNPLTKVGLEDARDVSLLLSVNQSEQPFQSEISGYTILTFHFNKETNLFDLRNEISFLIDSI